MGRKQIVGLAGAVGSGKSTVARMLGALGCGVVDSDELAREVLNSPAVREKLMQWWGRGILESEGSLDRRRISDIIFEDPGQRERLEALVYPPIADRRREWIARYEADNRIRVIVIDSPLLFEKGLDALCDRVIFVDADESVRLKRLEAGRGWTEAELRRREKFQESPVSKRRKADCIVENNSSIDACQRRVEKIFQGLIQDGGKGHGQSQLH